MKEVFEAETQAAYLKRNYDLSKPESYQHYINSKFINHHTGAVQSTKYNKMVNQNQVDFFNKTSLNKTKWKGYKNLCF